jgi:hypothetical protein
MTVPLRGGTGGSFFTSSPGSILASVEGHNPNGRAVTDKSLDTERRKTDHELAHRRATVGLGLPATLPPGVGTPP